MKKLLLTSFLALAATTPTWAAPTLDEEVLRAFRKNFARHHLQTQLSQFDAATGQYKPAAVGGTWTDDDLSTGAKAAGGQQYYLLTLAETELLTGFCLSGDPTMAGTVSIYIADELSAPNTEGKWSPIARNIPVAEVNDVLYAKPFSRDGKYFLIETNFSNPGNIYSLHLFGMRSAVSFKAEKRENGVEPQRVLSEHEERLALSFSGLYAKALVNEADAGGAAEGWQRIIDDNPNTSISFTGDTGRTGALIDLKVARPLNRFAVKTVTPVAGRFDFFLVNGSVPAEVAFEKPPVASITLDGTTTRGSVDFASTAAREVRVRWTPAAGTTAVEVAEVEAFADTGLHAYAVVEDAGEVAAEQYADASKDGKEFLESATAREPASATEPELPTGRAVPFTQPNPNYRETSPFPGMSWGSDTWGKGGGTFGRTNTTVEAPSTGGGGNTGTPPRKVPGGFVVEAPLSP